MSPTIHDLGIDRLSTEDRLRLISEIWDSLPANTQGGLSADQQAELDRRIAAADADPAAGIPWDEAKRRLLGDA